MTESSLSQSAKRRAWEDTKKSFHSIKFFWVVEVVIMAGFGVLATLLTPENANRTTSAIYPAIGAIIGAIVGFLMIYLIMLGRAPYKQRNEARLRIKELEINSREAKLFDILCSTTSLGLPINQLADGSYRASSVSLGINPILILHRGDLTTITHFIMSPVIIFTRKDGWETTDAIKVIPRHNVVATPLTQGFTWDTNNPQQWVLNGLPLTLAKGEKLTLPGIWVSVPNGNEAGAHFEKKETCTLLMRFAIRTDKGAPLLPDHQILLTMSDIKNSSSGLGTQPKPEEGITQ